MREKVSVALIVKDASECIGRCLQSVSWADEIVVLDGHSTDGTQEIAKSFGGKVIEKDFESFPIERSCVLEHTTYDWVLSLDADMIVPEPLVKEIQLLLAEGPPCDGYLMRCLNHFLGVEVKHCSWFDYRFLRFFNKKKGKYDTKAKVLDHFMCQGKVGKLNHYLVHHQTENLEQYLKKMIRLFAPFTADEYMEKGVRIVWWNMPWFFFLRPALTFLYKFVWKKGFLDGIPGFIICSNSAILYFFIFTIIWNRQNGKTNYQLERYLLHS